MDSSFRIKLDFSALNIPPCTNKTAWYLLNPTVCDNVHQLKRRICEWFEIESVLNEMDLIQVFLDNCLVPDKESVLIFKANDLVVFRSRFAEVVKDETKTESSHNVINELKTHSKRCKRSKRSKRENSKERNGHENQNRLDLEEEEELVIELPTEETEKVTKHKKKKKKVIETESQDEEHDNKVEKKKKRHRDSEPMNEDPSGRATKDEEVLDDEEEDNSKRRRKKRKKQSKSVESEKVEEIPRDVSSVSENVQEKKDGVKKKPTSSSLRRQRRKQKKGILSAKGADIEIALDTSDKESRSRKLDDEFGSTDFAATNGYETLPSKHIRFDDNEQCIIRNSSLVTNGEPAKESKGRSSGRDNLEQRSSHEREVSQLKSKYLAMLAKRDVLMNTSTILTNPIDDETPRIKPTKDYLQYPLLEGPPRVNDIVAYKTLELSENYTPEVSEFKVAKVLEYDNEKREVLLKLQEPVNIGNRRGKFELTSCNEENEEEDHQETEEILLYEVTLQTSSFVDIRLVTDPM